MIDHKDDKLAGTRELVANFPLVKPKIERLNDLKGCEPDDIKDFVGAKSFLISNHGVR